jgi:hypothetical protein
MFIHSFLLSAKTKERMVNETNGYDDGPATIFTAGIPYLILWVMLVLLNLPPILTVHP